MKRGEWKTKYKTGPVALAHLRDWEERGQSSAYKAEGSLDRFLSKKDHTKVSKKPKCAITRKLGPGHKYQMEGYKRKTSNMA